MAIENKKVKLDNAKRGSIISFFNDDYLEGFNCDHDDSVVIIATVHNYVVKRILANQGSLADISYSAIAASMNIHKKDLKPHIRNLVGFLLVNRCLWRA